MTPRKTAQDYWRTPQLHTPFHARLSALMDGQHWYDWAGYAAPSRIDDTEMEYFAIRSTAALFDISPMVKYRIEGPDAEAFLNHLTVRDVAKLKPGRVQYTAWCDDDGFVLDDGTLFRFSDTLFRLCCQERHLPWLLDTAYGYDVAVTEETEVVAGLALQGPTSAAILRQVGVDVATLRPFWILPLPTEIADGHISRTGFTGDLGYELFVRPQDAEPLWDRLWEAGQLRGICAIGYDALNTARVEAGFIVANGDFVTAEGALRSDRPARPNEIGLGWMVATDKHHFTGKRAIQRASPRRALVGLEIEGNEPAHHAIVYRGKKREAGVVTAATWSPTAKRNIALASMDIRHAAGTDLWVEIYALREQRYHKLMKRARIVDRPFVSLGRRSATPPGDF